MKSFGAKVITLSVICLAAGFALGCYFGIPSSSSENSGGDISKVSKFRMSNVSSQKSAYEEKLLSDTLELRKAAFSLLFLTSRMDEFSQLVELSEQAAAGNETLHPSLTRLSNMKSISQNAYQAGVAAAEALGRLAGGEKVNGGAVDQATQNLSLAYLMVGRQLNAAKYFVAEVDSYLKGKSLESNADLALARDKWAVYCATEAALNDDQPELSEWKETTLLSSRESLSSLCTMVRNMEAVALNNSVWDTVLPVSGIQLWANEVPSSNLNFNQTLNGIHVENNTDLNRSETLNRGPLRSNISLSSLANTNLADLRCLQCGAIANINDLGARVDMEALANAVRSNELGNIDAVISNDLPAKESLSIIIILLGRVAESVLGAGVSISPSYGSEY